MRLAIACGHFCGKTSIIFVAAFNRRQYIFVQKIRVQETHRPPVIVGRRGVLHRNNAFRDISHYASRHID